MSHPDCNVRGRAGGIESIGPEADESGHSRLRFHTIQTGTVESLAYGLYEDISCSPTESRNIRRALHSLLKRDLAGGFRMQNVTFREEEGDPRNSKTGANCIPGWRTYWYRVNG